jgi:predicted nuclease of predicted toxin-antitoxin system
MIRLLFDQNFNQRISRGLRKRIPDLDCVTTEKLGFKKFTDDLLLTKAAELDRVIITHDEKTFHIFAYKKIELGEKMAGLVVVPDSLPIG